MCVYGVKQSGAAQRMPDAEGCMVLASSRCMCPFGRGCSTAPDALSAPRLVLDWGLSPQLRASERGRESVQDAALLCQLHVTCCMSPKLLRLALPCAWYGMVAVVSTMCRVSLAWCLRDIGTTGELYSAALILICCQMRHACAPPDAAGSCTRVHVLSGAVHVC